MSWWNSLEKAGNISKLAITALKSAQQKIDEVLDITDEATDRNALPTILEISTRQFDVTETVSAELNESSRCESKPKKSECEVSSECADLEKSCSTRLGSHHSSLTDSLENVIYDQSDHSSPNDSDKVLTDENTKTDELWEVNSTLFNDCSTVTEQKASQDLCEKEYDESKITISSEYIAQESVDVTSHLSFLEKELQLVNKSIPNEDITTFHRSSSDIVLPFTAQPVCADDDFDTNTTSSDIEVISCCNSTNGGEVHDLHSSNTPTIMSPIKGPRLSSGLNQNPLNLQKYSLRGFSAPVVLNKCSSGPEHRRSVSVSQDLHMGLQNTVDDDLTFAYHDLSKKFSDVKHLLNVREAKIMQLSHENNVLQNSVSILQEQLRTSLTTQEINSTDVSSITSEFSQRLSDTEKRLQLVCRERDQLKKSLSSVKQKIPIITRAVGDDKPFVNNDIKRVNELENVILQKNEEIENLLKEGHKLAADQLKTNNLLKKLRSEQEKSKQTQSSHLKQIEQLTAEVQRLRNSLENKEEILGIQLANSTRQTKVINNLEEQQEILKIQISKNEIKISEQTQELETLINENSELKEQLNQIHCHSKAESQCVEDLEKAKAECETLKQKLNSNSRDLRAFKTQHEEQAIKWREEIQYYQGLLSDAQLKIDLLNETTTTATQPIMKQLEILQSNFNNQAFEWETKERQLNKLLAEYKHTADSAQTSEESWRSQLQITEDNLAVARLELNSLKQKYIDLLKTFTAEQEKSQGIMFDIQELTVKLETSKSEINELHSRISELQQVLLSEEQRYKTLEAVNNNLCLQLEEMKLAKDQPLTNKVIDQPLNSHSLDRRSSLNNEVASIPKTFQLSSDMVNQASMEYFQSHLHLREGECAHLKREIEQLTSTQEKLLTEVAKQTARAEKYEKLAGVKYTKHVNRTLSQSDPFAPITNNHHDRDVGDVIDDNDPTMELQQRYETLLILCGKLTEENNELKLDLADVKEMYRAQIDMLLKSQ
ncbi:unnamed protein product [Schistosoma rodhaini]|uniref:TATA element modulatory factor 1 TATA binding domain-containing protein n=1 Tax=Schistosoma rodhaini TaxID=6188 RepID=A0AA85F419_9TREM|nr:unnamed protein product [Schistosoma rodhaini]